MFKSILQNQRTLDFEGYLAVAAEAFIIDRRAGGLAVKSLEFYHSHLKQFIEYCDNQSVTMLYEITPDFIRRYLLLLSESHNEGGVHAAFRTLRAFLRWVEFEELLPDWKNPIHKVKAPKVSLKPIEPISLDDVMSLISACKNGNNLERDKAIFLTLLDTGLRAGELCNINLDDINLDTGEISIKKSKSRKPRTVFVGRKTRRALRAYLRKRRDICPALFITIYSDRITYNGLREILRRRSRDAGLSKVPSLHDFRRAFALNFLRNGGDIFSLQRLMGHSDLSVLRRYLAQSTGDIQIAHGQNSPVDRGLK